jgi:hypothetical protein
MTRIANPITERLSLKCYHRLWRRCAQPYADLPEVWDCGSDVPVHGAAKARVWRRMIAHVAAKYPAGVVLISYSRKIALVLNYPPPPARRVRNE